MVTDDERIRAGLKFLFKADRRVVKAAVHLERLTGVADPPGVAEVLTWYRFQVEGTRYDGRMTQEQNNLLTGHQDTLRHFADAIADLLLNLNDAVVAALEDLCRGLDGQPGEPLTASERRQAFAGITKPALGTCDYDTGQQRSNVTQSFCESGLQGTWQENPHIRRPR